MTLDRHLRALLAIVIVIAMVLLLVAVLSLTESALDVWDRFRQVPRWIAGLWLGALGLLALASGWAILRLLFTGRRKKRQPEELTAAALEERIVSGEQLGIDVSEAREELALLTERKTAGDFRVALFGEISTGKSAVIRALLPDVDNIDISPRGGSTREVSDYIWTSPAGDRLVISDVPGLNEAGGVLDKAATDEAARAHAVVFVCDQDLTREQYDAITALREVQRPMVIALNKADRLSEGELRQVRERIGQRIVGLDDDDADAVDVVAISAAPAETVVRQLPDGSEQRETRVAPPRVEELADALQRMMDRDPALMEELRDASVFLLARRHLQAAENDYRKQRSAELVSSYTKKAVVGALAAVAPGTDVLIQGYLGANFVRELCELYDVSPRDIDVQQFLKLSQTHIGRTLPLLMAIGGNALKAFPGAGTVAGGLMHAVAYGLIFDALGSSLTQTLNESGRLRPAPAASLFRKQLGENLEKRTARVAKLAWDARRKLDD